MPKADACSILCLRISWATNANRALTNCSSARTPTAAGARPRKWPRRLRNRPGHLRARVARRRRLLPPFLFSLLSVTHVRFLLHDLRAEQVIDPALESGA